MTSTELSERVAVHIRDQYQLPADKIAEMLPTFLSILQNHMRNLEDTLATGDVQAIGSAGHALKGALLNLGLAEIAVFAMRIEVEGMAGSHDADYADLLAQLKSHLKEIL